MVSGKPGVAKRQLILLTGRAHPELAEAVAKHLGVAITPLGDFKTYREYDVSRYEGDLGSLYRPKFIVGGVAIHGSPSIPNYPASHGCVRVANPVMDLIWGQNLLPLRSAVWIHD